MKAITFDGAIPRYLLTKAAGSVSTGWLAGRGRCTLLAEVDEPSLPGDRWVRIRTRLGGICGSDLNLITLRVSPSTSPFSSFPFVVGHENVGVIAEVGAAVRDFAVGDRVVVNPLLACEARGIHPPCRHCAEGNSSRCESFTEGRLAPGMMMGTTRGVGGSWGDGYVAHESQLYRVPTAVSDRAALLLEPMATVLSPLLAHLLPEAERVLVIGGGSIGLLAVAGLRALVPAAEVTVLARYDFQGEEALRLGAHHVVRSRGRSDHFDELARISHGRLLRPILGPRIQIGGFDASLVCVGNAPAVEDALRFTRAGGHVYLIGNVSRLPSVDWTPLWMKELTVTGSLCYNVHTHGGARRHCFEIGMDLLASGWAERLEPLVTHTFPLSSYREALELAFSKSKGKSVKVAFAFEDGWS